MKLPTTILRRTVASCLLILASFGLSTALADKASAAELPTDLPAGGLAIISGAEAETHALAMAQGGRWLVRIIATDADQARKMAEATAALHPLITVSVDDGRLPFGPQTINTVILGTGSSLVAEEVDRVLAPQGLRLTAQGLTWQREVQPVDARHAPWTDYKADSHGTGVSADTAVAPSSSLRWFDQSFVGQHVRTANGVAGYTGEAAGAKKLPKHMRIPYAELGLHGIDVYSGVPLWKHPNIPKYMSIQLGYVAHPLGFIHAQGKVYQPAVLTDLHSGEIRVTYDEGLSMLAPRGDPDNHVGSGIAKALGIKAMSTDNLVQLVEGDILVQIYGYDVAVLDVPTGRKLWGMRLETPSVMAIISHDGKRLYITETNEPATGRGRWGSFATVAMGAYNLSNGRQLWRNIDWATSETLIEGKKRQAPTDLSEFIDTGDGLFAWDQTSNIGSDAHADLHRIDPETGEVLWVFTDANFKDPNDGEYWKHGTMTNNMVFWNGKLMNKIAAYSLDGPEGDQSIPIFIGGNQRCVRLSGSANYLLWGHTGYFSKDGVSSQGFLTRGNCAMPNYPTYGAVLSVTDETCGCYNGLRGNAALVPEGPISLINDDQRLSKTPALVAVTAEPAALPTSPIMKAWVPFRSLRLFAEYGTLGPVEAGPVQLQVDVQRHLVSGLRDGKVVWRYRADGRVHTLPSMHNDLAYVSTTNGTVTAIELTSGKPQWSFLAALNRDQLVLNGQLESRWPVHHTLVKDGTLYVAAGRHVEVDGGIALWALDAATGAIQHHARIHQPLSSSEESGVDHRWRTDRGIASRAIQPDGMFLNDAGEVCLGSRFWPTAARATMSGMWGKLSDKTKKREDRLFPNFEEPMRQLIPVDLAAWNGRTLHPITDLAQK